MAEATTDDIIRALGSEIAASPSESFVTITESLATQARRRLQELRNETVLRQQPRVSSCPGGVEYDFRSAPEPEPTPKAVDRTPGPRLTHNDIGKMVEIVVTDYDGQGLLADRVVTYTGILDSFASSKVTSRAWLRGQQDYLQVAYKADKDYEFKVLS